MIVSPGRTCAPAPGSAVLATVIVGGSTSCSVPHGSHSGSPPPPVATTLLPTLPVASASTVVVQVSAYVPASAPAASVHCSSPVQAKLPASSTSPKLSPGPRV